MMPTQSDNQRGGRQRVNSPDIRLRYILFLGLFTAFSLGAQFGCATPVDLSFLFGEGWWVPLGTITLVPFVDVCRSFAQHYSEQLGISVRVAFALMMSCSFLVSLGFAVLGSLPINICLATVAAVNVGGFMDLLIFRRMIRVSDKPHVRMLFSNFAAAFSGGALFYWIAFSDLLTRLATGLDISYENPYGHGSSGQRLALPESGYLAFQCGNGSGGWEMAGMARSTRFRKMF